jgi:hypothetical protein
MEIFQAHVESFISTLFDSNSFDLIDQSYFLDTELDLQQV